jgi:hypothetical protein
VPPGEYRIRLVLDGKTLEQRVVVKADPRDSISQADYEAGFAFAMKYSVGVYSKIDTILNGLDALKKSLDEAAAAVKDDAALSAQIDAAQKRRTAIFDTFTANFQNDEDSIQHPGKLREEIPRSFGAAGPPTAEQLDYANRFDAAYGAALAAYGEYAASLQPLSKAIYEKTHHPLVIQ